MPRSAKRTTDRPEPGAVPIPAPAPSNNDELDLFTTLARTSLFLEALQRECLGAHHLTFSEYSVLRLLQRAESRQLTPSQLAEAVICTTGAMTKLVDRLQRNAFVERKPNPSDRRAVLVEITSVGQKAADQASATYRTGRERILSELGKDEAERIHQQLGRLLEVFEIDRKNNSDAEQRAS